MKTPCPTTDKASKMTEGDVGRHPRRALRRRGICPRIARRGIESSQRSGRYRWVVERSFAWLHASRRLRVRYERRPGVHHPLLSLGCIIICARSLHREFRNEF
jgi:hypothetical protein